MISDGLKARKTTRGWVQGYYAQAVVGDGQIILAAEISIESLDTANLAPMIQTAIGELEAVGVTATPGVVLADAGYWTNDAIEALCGEGIRRWSLRTPIAAGSLDPAAAAAATTARGAG
jgi:hypothetical protein